MADHDSLVDQFVGVTGTEPSRARFCLESAAWDLELAMSSFFEGADNNDDGPGAEVVEDVSMPTDNTAPQSAAIPSNRSNRVQTFSSMHVDSDSDDEGQAYYAGGSDRSGQQVLGPPKKKDTNKLVDTLFKSAREHGAEEKKEEDQPSRANRATFVGAGYRLGETPEDTQVVAGSSRPSGPARQVDKKLKLWKNGFSVDDGPLRDFNDAQNKQFLDSIAKGEVPQELVSEARGGEVNLDMEDHRTEDYVKPKVKVKAFTGAGHMLGSEEPNCFSPAPNVIASNPPAGDRSAPAIQVDDKKPVTNVQLRLADGSRLVLKLNHTHHVSDIRQHIIATNPQYAQSNFCLMTTFPNKELTEETQTIEEAKLINSVVVQRMK